MGCKLIKVCGIGDCTYAMSYLTKMKYHRVAEHGGVISSRSVGWEAVKDDSLWI